MYNTSTGPTPPPNYAAMPMAAESKIDGLREELAKELSNLKENITTLIARLDLISIPASPPMIEKDPPRSPANSELAMDYQAKIDMVREMNRNVKASITRLEI